MKLLIYSYNTYVAMIRVYLESTLCLCGRKDNTQIRPSERTYLSTQTQTNPPNKPRLFPKRLMRTHIYAITPFP